MLRFTLFIVMMTSSHLVFAENDYCNLNALKVHTRTACRKLYARFPRSVDFSKDGYEIEKITETRHRRQTLGSSKKVEYAKKITHPDFPKCAYLVVHSPYSQYVKSSKNFHSQHAHNRNHSTSVKSWNHVNKHCNQNLLSNNIEAPRHNQTHKKHKKYYDEHMNNEVLSQDMYGSSSYSHENIISNFDGRIKRDANISITQCCNNSDCEWLLCSADFIDDK